MFSPSLASSMVGKSKQTPHTLTHAHAYKKSSVFGLLYVILNCICKICWGAFNAFPLLCCFYPWFTIHPRPFFYPPFLCYYFIYCILRFFCCCCFFSTLFRKNTLCADNEKALTSIWGGTLPSICEGVSLLLGPLTNNSVCEEREKRKKIWNWRSQDERRRNSFFRGLVAVLIV